MLNIQINEVFHQSTRIKIVAYLIASGETDYSTIKKLMEISDGQMTTHMRVLLAKEYVTVRKFFENNKPKTVYKITEKGISEFEKYLADLKVIMDNVSKNPTEGKSA